MRDMSRFYTPKPAIRWLTATGLRHGRGRRRSHGTVVVPWGGVAPAPLLCRGWFDKRNAHGRKGAAVATRNRRSGNRGTFVVPWVVRQTKDPRQERRCRGYAKSTVR